ncbi:type II secretion system protein GspD [Leptospirillum ferrooxidans]|jgi:hypothetical protein|uniref:Putative type II secretion system protein D n=1 Tax=Leptospirillum ferrooxidans (strain C2-3) TaxID=1162668 RepID=I0ILS0_LEPFC|nr:type II secretion system protein D [Leptospirillum ferrooxidans]BAM06219.1 putative type II secretion system protein D [Leptospirillum ferrooxidans C2-3]
MKKRQSFLFPMLALMLVLGACQSAPVAKKGTLSDLHPVYDKKAGKIDPSLPQVILPLPQKEAHVRDYDYLNKVVSGDFRGTRLSDTLELIMPEGITVVWGDMNPSEHVFISIRKKTLRQALDLILKPMGAAFLPAPDHIRVTRHETILFRLPVPNIRTILMGSVGSNPTTPGGGSGSSGGGMGGGMAGGMGGGMAGGMGGGMGGGLGGMTGGMGGGMGANQGTQTSGNVTVNMSSGLVTFWDSLKKTLDGMKGPHGVVRVDTESGYVYVHDQVDRTSDIRDYLNRVRNALRKQVYLKVEIAEIQLNQNNSFGVNWNALLKGVGAQFTTIGAGAQNAGLAATGSQFAPYSIGVTSPNGTSTAILQALDQIGHVHLVSQPRILTLSGLPTTINATTNIPYLQSEMPFAFGGLNSSSLVIPQISYATVGLNLEITAVIDHDSIRLHVVPVLNTLTQFVSIAVQGVGTFQEPEIASRALSSDILTRSNNTVIMGGLISNTISKQEYTIPFLGAIPGLKYLFSGYNDVRTVDEMVFIITPIVSDGFAVPEPTTRTLLHLKPEQAPLRTIPQKESTHITAGQM